MNIDAQPSVPKSMKIVPEVSAPDEVLNAIYQADVVILGPGSFLTSVIPPLLVLDIKHAIIRSPAVKILIANMVPEDGPTGKMQLSQKMHWMESVVGANIVDAIVWPHSRALNGAGSLNVIVADLFCREHERVHDRDKLAKVIREVVTHLRELKQKTA
ncbi:MAG TPA: hypothetical protein ENK06_10475 [Gammaproteobacteria bacterium]|nr:hypothetical protein [Gammaproteobacteria bacterium]